MEKPVMQAATQIGIIADTQGLLRLDAIAD
jgi:hypothetical protein